MKPFCWTQWTNKGIWILDYLYEGEHVVSFNHLKQKYNLPNNDFWKYLQIRHCLLATQKMALIHQRIYNMSLVQLVIKKEVVPLSML